MTKYKGFEIIKTYAHGYNYYKIAGEKELYSTLKGAKFAVDARLNN